MKAYSHHFQQAIKVILMYKTEVLLYLVSIPIFIIIASSLWKSLYDTSTVATFDVSLSQMLTYAIIGQILYAYMTMEIVFEIEERFKDGDLILDILKPIDLQMMYLSKELGRSIFYLSMRLLVILPLSFLFTTLILPADLLQWLLFFVALILAFLLVFALNYLIAGLCFWVTEIEPVDHLQGVLQLVLSGSVIPLWFFPSYIEIWAEKLPFVFFYQVPMAIFINQLEPKQAFTILSLGVGWLIVLLFAGRWLWGLGLQRNRVFGG